MQIGEVKALLFMKLHSERVHNKNIRKFCGKPLLYWILDALSKSKYISEVIINTDSKIIADMALKDFDVTIHMRPDHLLRINSDEANKIMEYDLSLTSGDYFIQTHSTNPLLRSETIDASIGQYFTRETHDSLFSVTAHHKRLFDKDGVPLNHEPMKLIKTQDLAPVYEENSCIYIFSRDTFNTQKNRIGQHPLLFPIDPLEAVDIDEESDFIFAEYLMKARLAGKG